MTKFLEVKNLRLYYQLGKKKIRAVDNISFEIPRAGQALALVGESGCGKSSLAYALIHLPPINVCDYSGEVWLEGENIFELSEKEWRERIRWKKISIVPQAVDSAFIPVRKIDSAFREVLKMPKVDQEITIARLFQMVGLSPKDAKIYPHQLSGGMKQRACIALALALNPSLVLLDEPTSALDVSLQGQIIELLEDLKKRLSFSYIFITHNIALARTICDLFAVIYAGQIVERGTTQAVINHPSHPYTRLLLECLPRLEKEGVSFIAGEPPDLGNLPPGCRFRPRCPEADSVCEEVLPDLKNIGGDHFVACHKKKISAN